MALVYNGFGAAVETQKLPSHNFFSTLAAAPALLLAVQFPEASVDTLEGLLSPYLEARPVVLVLVLVPFFLCASALTSAATFAVVQRLTQGKQPSLRTVGFDVSPKLDRLLGASLLSGLVILVSIALVLPALYFLSVYLFVPHLVVTEPRHPFTVYLSRSKKLAQTALVRTLMLTTALLVAGFLLYLLNDGIRSAFKGHGEWKPVAWMLNLAISLITGAIVNVLVSRYFLKLRSLQASQLTGSP